MLHAREKISGVRTYVYMCRHKDGGKGCCCCCCCECQLDSLVPRKKRKETCIVYTYIYTRVCASPALDLLFVVRASLSTRTRKTMRETENAEMLLSLSLSTHVYTDAYVCAYYSCVRVLGTGSRGSTLRAYENRVTILKNVETPAYISRAYLSLSPSPLHAHARTFQNLRCRVYYIHARGWLLFRVRKIPRRPRPRLYAHVHIYRRKEQERERERQELTIYVFYEQLARAVCLCICARVFPIVRGWLIKAR